MSGTLQVHFEFVIARTVAGSRLIGMMRVLHRDKLPLFRHIGAATVPSVVHALIVSGDNGSGRCAS
jgi:hypothetical protein